MYLELLNHYVLYPLNLQLIITFALMVRFEHMIRHFNRLNLKICLITFSCRSDGQKHCWFKTLIQARCALSGFRILICENPCLCEGQNVGSKMGCQHKCPLESQYSTLYMNPPLPSSYSKAWIIVRPTKQLLRIFTFKLYNIIDTIGILGLCCLIELK